MSDMWAMIATLPEQFRWAERLDPAGVPRASSVLVVGLGGSGIAGDYAAVDAEELGFPVRVHRGYELPGWVRTSRPLVVAVSYSGNTVETLSAVDAASALGLPVVAVSAAGQLASWADAHGVARIAVPGGLQPRAAVGYLAGAVVTVVRAAGGLDDPTGALSECAAVVEDLITEGSAGRSLAADLADGLTGRAGIIWASLGPTAVAARRWKTQLNENAKTAAYWSLLPELDHNEIVGMGSPPPLVSRSLGIVALRDSSEPPEVSRRWELSTEAVAVPIIGEVWARGESSLAKMMSLSSIGDMTSTYLAEATGVDPVAIDAITRLKNELRG